jgi:hypothetical protein
MCRCYAKNCSMDHFNGISGKGQRGNPQKRANDKRQANKKFETTSPEFDYSEEQVYNKTIDDLMDYIMKP